MKALIINQLVGCIQNGTLVHGAYAAASAHFHVGATFVKTLWKKHMDNGWDLSKTVKSGNVGRVHTPKYNMADLVH